MSVSVISSQVLGIEILNSLFDGIIENDCFMINHFCVQHKIPENGKGGYFVSIITQGGEKMDHVFPDPMILDQVIYMFFIAGIRVVRE